MSPAKPDPAVEELAAQLYEKESEQQFADPDVRVHWSQLAPNERRPYLGTAIEVLDLGYTKTTTPYPRIPAGDLTAAHIGRIIKLEWRDPQREKLACVLASELVAVEHRGFGPSTGMQTNISLVTSGEGATAQAEVFSVSPTTSVSLVS